MLKRISMLTVLLIFITGCTAAVPERRAANQVAPVTMEQYTLESSNPASDNKFRVFAALLLSLSFQQWEITSVDIDNDSFAAKHCLMEDNKCISINGNVSRYWTVGFYMEKNQFSSGDKAAFVNNLQRAYRRYTSMSTATLTKKISKTDHWKMLQPLAD